MPSTCSTGFGDSRITARTTPMRMPSNIDSSVRSIVISAACEMR